jgi:hypothetical protein
MYRTENSFHIGAKKPDDSKSRYPALFEVAMSCVRIVRKADEMYYGEADRPAILNTPANFSMNRRPS